MTLTIVDDRTQHPATVRGLFNSDLPNRALLEVVLRGTYKAAIAVDDQANPSRCLIRTGFYGFSFYAGPLDGFLSEAVERMRIGAQVVLVWPGEWEAKLAPDCFVAKAERVEFTARDPSLDRGESLPDDLEIQPIDSEMLKRCQWRHEFSNASSTPPEFFEGSIGICLTRGEEILSEAYASWWGDALCEIGAITQEAHQRKGYARLLCQRLARECENLGYQTTWTCHKSNRGSMATAEALGYQASRPYYLLEYRPL